MKSFVSILITLYVITCHAREQADPALVPLTFGKEPKAEAPVVIANVQYEFSRAPEVKRLAENKGFFFYDVQPVRKGVRAGQAVTSMMDQRKFETLLSKSGIFLSVTTPRSYEPGFFYVYVKPYEGHRATRYFQSAHIQAEEWRYKWLMKPHPKIILFQCQVDAGEELLWITALRKQAFVDSIFLTPEDYFTTTLAFPLSLNANQKTIAAGIMKEYGLFFDRGIYNEPSNDLYSSVRVPQAKETYFIKLFKEHGIAMTIEGMSDSEATDVVQLKSQDPVRSDTVMTSLSQSEIMVELQKFLGGKFPNWRVAGHSEAMIKYVSEDYFGPKVLSNIHNNGWERVEVKVTVSRLENNRVNYDVGLKTWFTPHGNHNNHPSNLYRIGEPPSTPLELNNEQNYTGWLLSQIVDHFTGRSRIGAIRL